MIAALIAACVAFHPLTPALAAQAAKAGALMARFHRGYAVAPWVIYQSRDPLSAVHGRAGIDAIVLETPYERVRYYTYLHVLQGDRITHELVTRLYRQARSQLGFIVYAHSKTDQDRTFLQRFSDARLSNGRSIERVRSRDVFGPSTDFYDVGTFREQRWVGSLTLRFSLPVCAGSERFFIRGPYGTRYSVPFDLTRYR